MARYAILRDVNSIGEPIAVGPCVNMAETKITKSNTTVTESTAVPVPAWPDRFGGTTYRFAVPYGDPIVTDGIVGAFAAGFAAINGMPCPNGDRAAFDAVTRKWRTTVVRTFGEPGGSPAHNRCVWTGWSTAHVQNMLNMAMYIANIPKPPTAAIMAVWAAVLPANHCRWFDHPKYGHGVIRDFIRDGHGCGCPRVTGWSHDGPIMAGFRRWDVNGPNPEFKPSAVPMGV